MVLGILVFLDLWGISKRYLNNEKKGSKYKYWVDKHRYANPFQPTSADMFILNHELEENPSLKNLANKEIEQIQNQNKLKKEELNTEKAKVYFRELNYATNYRVLSLNNPFSEARESYFHKSLGGYHGAKLRSFDELIDFHISREYSHLAYLLKNNADRSQIIEFPVLNMLNTKYIIFDYNSAPLVNPNRFGPAWFVDSIKVVKNADKEMLALENIEKSFAIVQKKYIGETDTDTHFINDSSAIILLDQYRPNHLVYKTKRLIVNNSQYSLNYYLQLECLY
ncbi:MAG: hypothetical protein HC906_05155 [Bacteroidales bacterium]|nr:hypothetical protein [Bacteroidales bacterium]